MEYEKKLETEASEDNIILQVNNSEVKSKIMTEKLRLKKLPLHDSVYSKAQNPNEKNCKGCQQSKNSKKLWLVKKWVLWISVLR